MKILIIGGTGTISYEITKLLEKNKKNKLTLVNRKKKKKSISKNTKIIKCDYRDLKNKIKYLEFDYDVVVNFIVYNKKNIVNDYRLFQNRTKLYVFISTASVYRNKKKSIITENSISDENRWWYQREKIKCEKYLIQKYKKYKFPILIIRPGHIYNENILPVSIWSYGIDLINYFLKTRNAFVFENNHPWSIMHSKDFAANFNNILKNRKKFIGKIINICGEKITNWKKIYKTYANILKIKKINFLILKNNKLKYLPKEMYYQIVSDRSKFYVFSNKKIKSLAGHFQDNTSLKSGLLKCIEKNRTFLTKKNINKKIIDQLKKAT